MDVYLKPLVKGQAEKLIHIALPKTSPFLLSKLFIDSIFAQKDIAPRIAHLLDPYRQCTLHIIKKPNCPVYYQSSHGEFNLLTVHELGIFDSATDTLLLVYPRDYKIPQLPISSPISTQMSTQMSDIPVILLDVDGVINAGMNSHLEGEWEDMKTVHVLGGAGNMEFAITYSPTVIKQINEWKAQILWLTTWGQMAADRLAPALGLNQFQVAPFYKSEVPEKLSQEMLNRPLLWIDDEFHPDFEQKYDTSRVKEPGKALAKKMRNRYKTLAPSGPCLLPADLETINTFLNQT